ncbi:hypothetical protein RFI_22367 [Reticulomyxa filosa]|uniref:Uncharacterized protein n=1 Tax=Reticulomyxa filosa TaxID=46433 RepID=X6MMW8_RETFI|nr:hypothetical protein RFI_22367 [Reticulomyxa filosa]|eukprot:ETO15001.1 hypothetical protein RFI_22367 [Reticulomyxa filosa]
MYCTSFLFIYLFIYYYYYMYMYVLFFFAKKKKKKKKKKKRVENQEESKQVKEELERNAEFSKELASFLKLLKSVTEHQQLIVKEFEISIENMESDLLRIRHEMTNVRQNTFAQIYDLHKHIEIADLLSLGQHRVSVVCAAIQQQQQQQQQNTCSVCTYHLFYHMYKRHHTLKIQRQLSSLQSQLRVVDVELYTRRLGEMIDLEIVMSDPKLKAFFSVFVQSFCQTAIDVDLFHRQIHASSINPNSPANVTASVEANMRNELSNFYGVGNILHTIDSQSSKTLDLKVKKTMHFINLLRNAVAFEQQQEEQLQERQDRDDDGDATANDQKKSHPPLKAKIENLALVALFVGRKLCSDLDMQKSVEETEKMLVCRLAEMRCQDIFRAIVDDVKIFHTPPHSIAQVNLFLLPYTFRFAIISFSSTTYNTQYCRRQKQYCSLFGGLISKKEEL